MVDAVASNCQDTIKFVTVAGRSDLEPTAEEASNLLADNVVWGLDDSIWDLYEILGQPASAMTTGNDLIVEGWYGALGEAALREKLDSLASI